MSFTTDHTLTYKNCGIQCMVIQLRDSIEACITLFACVITLFLLSSTTIQNVCLHLINDIFILPIHVPPTCKLNYIHAHRKNC